MEGSNASVEIEDFLSEVHQVRFENHPIELQGSMIILCALQGVWKVSEEQYKKRSKVLEQILLDSSASGGGP